MPSAGFEPTTSADEDELYIGDKLLSFRGWVESFQKERSLLVYENVFVHYQPSTNLTLRLLMSYIYGAPILDVSRSHTTTQHSR